MREESLCLCPLGHQYLAHTFSLRAGSHSRKHCPAAKSKEKFQLESYLCKNVKSYPTQEHFLKSLLQTLGVSCTQEATSRFSHLSLSSSHTQKITPWSTLPHTHLTSLHWIFSPFSFSCKFPYLPPTTKHPNVHKKHHKWADKFKSFSENFMCVFIHMRVCVHICV